MYKKTLLSLAVASSVALTGCFEDAETGKNAGSRANIQDSEFEGKTWPVFNPATSQLPLPNDLIFDSDAGDGSFGVDINPGDEDNPVTNALNELSGASTVAPAVVRFNDKIDPDSVDSRSVIPDGSGGFEPNPEQNVFLLELDYASEEPVRGLSNSEPPNVSGQAAIEVDVADLDGASALRILPTEPLDPLKRYVVVVTKEIMTDGENSEPITASPSYTRLSEDDEDAQISGDLASVQTLINDLWETSALKFIDAANNQQRDDDLTSDDIALTYSFTTSGDEKMLSYIGEPARWIEDQLRRNVKVSAVKKVTGAAKFFAGDELDPDTWDLNDDGTVNAEDFDRNDDGEITPEDFLLAGNESFGHADTSIAADDAVAAFDPSEYVGNACDSENGDDKFVCTADNLAPGLDAATSGFPTPSERTDFQIGSSVDDPDGGVTYHQGSIDLPYYLGVPDGNAEPIRTQSWSVDQKLASEIAQETGFAIPQADPDKSETLNYNFPFPKEAEEASAIDVPILVITPQGVTDDSLNDGTVDIDRAVIFQHGITTDRSAAVAFGKNLVNAAKKSPANLDVAVIAIDQPLHGIDADGPTIPAPFISAAFEGQGINDNGPTERHFGYEADAEGNADNPQPMDFEGEAVGGTGSLFINLSNFLAGRDNLRQGAVDLMNVRKTIEQWDNVDSTNTFFVGHSLGTLNGGAYVGAANRTSDDGLKVAGSHLINPANGVSGLIQNSPSFAPQIFGGLAQEGLEPGDANLETFINVNQHALDSADVVNFASDLGDVLIGQVDGDLTTPNAAIDDDSVTVTQNSNAQGNPPLEIGAYPAGDGTTFEILGRESPLAGSEQLARIIDANNVDGTNSLPLIMRHAEGVHSTAIGPEAASVEKYDIYRSNGEWTFALEDGEEELVDQTDAEATFGLMVEQTLELIDDQQIDD